MELHQCATLGELTSKLKTSANMSAWIGYLELKDELERKKMQAMMGGD
jgi:hypothetical protein